MLSYKSTQFPKTPFCHVHLNRDTRANRERLKKSRRTPRAKERTPHALLRISGRRPHAKARGEHIGIFETCIEDKAQMC